MNAACVHKLREWWADGLIPATSQAVTASAENTMCWQYSLIHASKRSRLEAVEPSVWMHLGSTSRASDGPMG